MKALKILPGVSHMSCEVLPMVPGLFSCLQFPSLRQTLASGLYSIVMIEIIIKYCPN